MIRPVTRLSTIAQVLRLSRTLPAGPTPDDEPSQLALTFMVTLGRALHRYGTDAERLEGALGAVADSLGVHARFFSTPTMLMISFGRDGQHGTRLLRERPGVVDLGRLTTVDRVGQAVVDGDLTLEEGLAQLRALDPATPAEERPDTPPPSPRHWTAPELLGDLAAPPLLGFGVALPLGGGWLDALVAALIGLLVGVVATIATRSPRALALRDLAAALVTGASVRVALAFFPVQEHVVAIAALVALLPGLSLTTAMSELATQHLASGTARLAGAVVVLVQLGLGLALGASLVVPLIAIADAPHPLWAEPPFWASWALVPVVAGAFWLLFRSELRDLPWIVFASVLALGGAQLGALMLEPALAGFVGALLVGSLAHLYGRYLRRPSANILVPGITFLVPGSIGLTSLTSFIEQDITRGVEAAVTMTLVAVSLVAGMLVSALLVRPRGSL